jgi:hypothetical protein
MRTLDEVLPVFDFSDEQMVVVDADPAATWDALLDRLVPLLGP